MSDFKLAKGADGSGVDDTFRDAFVAEVRQGFNELRVLEQHEALDSIAANMLSGGGVGVGNAWNDMNSRGYRAERDDCLPSARVYVGALMMY